MSDTNRTETIEEPKPTLHELRRAASEWCFVMDRGPDYGWFILNWRLPGLKPFVEREMKQ